MSHLSIVFERFYDRSLERLELLKDALSELREDATEGNVEDCESFDLPADKMYQEESGSTEEDVEHVGLAT